MSRALWISTLDNAGKFPDTFAKSGVSDCVPQLHASLFLQSLRVTKLKNQNDLKTCDWACWFDHLDYLRHYCDLLCLPSWTQTDCVPTWLFHDHKVGRKFTLRTEHHHLVFGSYSTQLPKWLRTPTLLKQIPAHGLVASNATAQNQLQEATGHNHSRYSALICLKLNEIMCHFLQWRVNQGGRDLELQDSDQTTCLGTPGNHNMWGLGVLRRITCAHLHSIWIVSVL